MSAITLSFVMSLAWMALTAQFDLINFIFGFLFSFAILELSEQLGVSPGKHGRWPGSQIGFMERQLRRIRFLGFFLWELILANLDVAQQVLKPNLTIKPGIIAVPIDFETDAEITLMANFITLTPGTVSLEVSTDRNTLYVHSIHAADLEQFHEEMDYLKKRVHEVFE